MTETQQPNPSPNTPPLSQTELRALIRQMVLETLAEVLTADEHAKLRQAAQTLIVEAVQGLFWQLEQQLPDPDEGLPLRPEIVERLHKFKHERPEGRPADEIARELGLDI